MCKKLNDDEEIEKMADYSREWEDSLTNEAMQTESSKKEHIGPTSDSINGVVSQNAGSGDPKAAFSIVESVQEIDRFCKNGRGHSRTYRITYRSHDATLRNDQVVGIHESLKKCLEKQLAIEIR